MKPDCNNLKNEYKNYYKLLVKVIKDAKFKFERNKIEIVVKIRKNYGK